MKNLVDIDDVLDLFGASDDDIYAKHTIEDALYEGTLKALSLPSAEKERKKGKWIFHLDDLFPEESTQECSVCHEEGSVKIQNDNFCPNCGADMRGDE